MYNYFNKIFLWSKIQDEIGEPPWEYDFLYNLPESEYPKYLAKIFKYRTGEKLPLSKKLRIENGELKINYEIDKKRCKTFNQKIQWLKLYDSTQLKRDCTDKIKVRDYVKEKIGEEYLKPVLQIIPNESHETVRCHCEQANDHLMSAWQSTLKSEHIMDCRADIIMSLSARNDVNTYFDRIDFDKLPNSFVIKTNHGSKWQYIIKNKNEYLNNMRLFEYTKRKITGWLEQEYWCWNGFEMQYKGIEPKILIEPLMREDINKEPDNIHVFCFNGIPKLYVRIQNDTIALYDNNFNIIDDTLSKYDKKANKHNDNLINQSFDLTVKLIKNFHAKFVRVDYLIYQNKIYFEEFTFSPYSGFHNFNKDWNLKLGNLLNIGENYEF